MVALPEHEDLRAFVAESNRIEGIGTVLAREVTATRDFLRVPDPTVGDLLALVRVLQPEAWLRERPGLDVQVGDHVAPPGGRQVVSALVDILGDAKRGEDPWDVHWRYLHLHPFTDGNGRTARALWAWQMIRGHDTSHFFGLPFLQLWYYQTLSRADAWMSKVAELERRVEELQD